MAHELQLIKHSSGILIPATPETSDLLQSKIKLGSVLVAEFRQVRNPAFHRRFFALLNLGFEYWEPTGGAISSTNASW
ncbi:phage protein [Escherichia coli]|uniref:Phage protein n=1 Tax=Escherichia coli TaxID=562 RepID=A0A377BFV7_ECOLX|nr:phage protein [Escherichia coli]